MIDDDYDCLNGLICLYLCKLGFCRTYYSFKLTSILIYTHNVFYIKSYCILNVKAIILFPYDECPE